MTQHIGIVGGSAEGAALCYRTICSEGARLLGGHAHPEISMHTASLQRYVDRIDRGDWPGVGEILVESAERLAAAGADFLVCPDNTFHEAFPHVAGRTARPWLHIAEVVADEAVTRGYRRLGLTGTRWLVESDVYPHALAMRGIECLLPRSGDRGESHRIIMEELVRGTFSAEAVAHFQRVIEDLKGRGCEAVVLGCTEIPLILSDANSALPTLDSTRLLALAALHRAIR